MKLRPYQAEQMQRVIDALKKSNAVILQSPVGTGKTRMGVAIVRALAVDTLWLAHTRELVSQADEALPCSVEVMTIQKAHSLKALPWIKFIVIDECHRTMGGGEDGMYRSLLRANPQAKVLGLTATPLRTDGRPLLRRNGGFYDHMILGKSVRWHCDNHTILNPKHFTSPVSIEDLKIIRQAPSHGGDYNMRDAAQKMTTSVLCGDVVAHYKRLAKNRQAVVFACDLQHARALAARFNEEFKYDTARIVSSKNTPELRKKTFKDFRAGVFTILVNVNIITEGWDYPELSVAILARPTKSRTLFVQMVGRVMRAAPDKPQPIVLDHGGVFHDHGQVTDPFDWVEGRVRSPAYLNCPSCGYVMRRTARSCSQCGMGWEAMSASARKRYERKSTVEELNEKLVLAEKLAQARLPKVRTPRLRDPDWKTFETKNVTSELQVAIYEMYLQDDVPEVIDIAVHFKLPSHRIRGIVCMETRKKQKEKQREQYQRHRERVLQRYRDKRDSEPKAPRKPLCTWREIDEEWTPMIHSPTPVEKQKAMRHLFETSDLSVAQIGEKYGVSVTTAMKICSMKNRKKMADRMKEERKNYSIKARLG